MAAQMLSGRLAVVTGGGRGIGKAVCQLFAQEKAHVIVADVDENAAASTVSSLEGNGSHHFAHPVDVTQSESVAKFFDAVRQKFNRSPDILINCAGITRDGFMLDMTESMFDDVVRVNLKGTFLMTQAASKLMVNEKVSDGSIVNISSIIGKVGNIGQCNYASTKAGVVGFTKSVAKELAKFGIRCNAIMPGFIETPMIATVPEKVLERVREQIPLKRTGKPEEVAEACAFLASSRSSYITGTVLEVTGGLFM